MLNFVQSDVGLNSKYFKQEKRVACVLLASFGVRLSSDVH